MVNHVRTLLLDLPGRGFIAGRGEEYTDPTYTPPVPTIALAAIRRVLFGVAPDRAARLYRTAQFMTVLHATPLAYAVQTTDPRLTYLPIARGSLLFAPAVTIAPLGGHSEPLYAVGNPPGADGRGRIAFNWTVTIIA